MIKNIAVIGRTEMLLQAAVQLQEQGYNIVFVATASASPESKAKPDDFRELAIRSNCPFFLCQNIDQVEIMNSFLAQKPDIVITMNWPGMLKENIVNAVPYGIVNAHGSDLPKYRGNACPNWAILNGDSQVGLTLHLINPKGLDNGPIVTKRIMPLTESTYIQDIYDFYKEVIPGAFVEAVELLQQEDFKPEEQDETKAFRCYPRRPSDGRIVWDHPAEQVHRLIRASSRPFSGAFCYFENYVKTTVFSATLISRNSIDMAVPGQILYYDGEVPVVACGNGSIRLDEIVYDDSTPVKRSTRLRFT